MRLSVDDMHGDDVYKAKLCRRAVIYLNGMRVERCVEADEENGFVVVLEIDDEGTPVLSGDDVSRKKLLGKVEIIDPLQMPKDKTT